jgi:hypothetical protein
MPPPPVPAFNLSASYTAPVSTLTTNNEINAGFNPTQMNFPPLLTPDSSNTVP